MNKDSFKNIKQTELRIIKKIDLKKPQGGGIDEEQVHLNDIILKDDQYALTKKIVSLKNEKQEAKIQKDKQAQNKGKKNFESASVDFKYALNETLVNKQNEKAKADYERQKKKDEDEKKMKKQSIIFQGINNPSEIQ